MAEMQVFTVISEINNLMETSRKVPLSNLIMLDKQRMDRLLDRLSDSLDPDLEKAEKLLARERELLDEVERRARETNEKATREANDMTAKAKASADETVRGAKASADETVRQATEHANQLVAGSAGARQPPGQRGATQAAQLVEENEITQRAQARAAEITEAAQQECARLRQETLANLSPAPGACRYRHERAVGRAAHHASAAGRELPPADRRGL